MNYPSSVLKSAMKRLKDIREKNKRLSEEKKRKLYEHVPELVLFNKEIAGILKECVSKNADSDKLKVKIIQSVEKRNLFLSSCGYSEDDLEDIHSCNICKDEGYINGKICSCYADILRQEAYKLSNLEEKTKTQNFESCNMSVFSDFKSMQVIYDYAMRFCNEDEKIKSNLFFLGNPGTGKTFLSSCIAKRFLDTGKSVLYLSAVKFSDIIDKYKFSKKNNSDLEDYMNFIMECDLLIIDDLGTECSMAYSQSQLFDIFETRILNKRRNVISTNLSLEELAVKYSSRFTSRIIENCEVLFFGSEDIRLKNSIQ